MQYVAPPKLTELPPPTITFDPEWKTLPPCKTFAEDTASRRAIEEESEATMAAAASLNDVIGGVADVTGSVAARTGKAIEAAETVSKGATYVAVAFALHDAYGGYTTGDPGKYFDAAYGLAALTAAQINPMIGVGMAISGIGSKFIPKKPSAIAEEMENAGPTCAPQ